MGRQMLNLFPLPDPALVGNPVTQGNYNYQFAGDTEKLRRDNVVRVDWNIRPGTTFYTRVQMGKEVFGRGQYQRDRTGADRRRRHGLPVVEGQLRHQHLGLRGHAHAHVHGLDRARGHRRDQLGDAGRVSAGAVRLGRPRLPESPAGPPAVLHREQSESHPAGHDVRAAPTPCPNTRAINIGQGQNFPWLASNDTHNFSVNLTHLRGKHNLKAGFFYERTGRPGALSSNAGTYNFNSDAANPLDTNLGLGERAARAPQHLHGEQQQHPVAAAVQPARVLRPGQLAREPDGSRSISASASRTSACVYEKDRDIGWFDPARLESGQGGAAVAAALRQRRVPLHRREPRGAQSDHRRTAAQSLDRRGRRRVGRHQQRHRLRQGDPRYLPQRRNPDRAASRVRLGRHRATARPRSAADSARATTAWATASTAGSPASSAGP